MSLENDIKIIMEADVFKPASKQEADARKDTARKSVLSKLGQLWVSLRFVRGFSEDDAVANVEQGAFVEEHPLCDAVISAAQITVNGAPIVDNLEMPLGEAKDVFQPASPEEAAKRQQEYRKNPDNFTDFAWKNELQTIIADYKEGSADEPLDGDDVDMLIENLRSKINYLEGNITEEEYADGVFHNPPSRR